jgi:hypothetical protein
MSFNRNELFMEPTTTQYGSHMVMSNVTKHSKHKYINIDTRFRDEYQNADNLTFNNQSSFNITLPDRITDVKTMTVTNVEIPISFYNISSNLGNNSFIVTDVSNNITATITIPDGQYSSLQTISNVINYELSNNAVCSTLRTDLSNSIIGSIVSNLAATSDPTSHINFYSSNQFKIDFTIGDKYNFKTRLGWVLGFRLPIYNIANSYCQSEQLSNLNGPKYLYLAIDEFNKGNQNSFLSPIADAFINKRIIARMAMDYAGHPFGTILPANRFNGLLTTDVRNYTGKIDLHKLNIQLLNEIGIPMNMNGIDFSLCIEVEHE